MYELVYFSMFLNYLKLFKNMGRYQFIPHLLLCWSTQKLNGKQRSDRNRSWNLQLMRRCNEGWKGGSDCE
jgi:hypothetical protein